MEQGLSINKIYPQKLCFSPVFTGRISTSVIKSISEATLKTYSTAISAMGMAGIAINLKEDNQQNEITENDFVKLLKSKHVPENKLRNIIAPCINKNGKIDLETVENVLSIIDITTKTNWKELGYNLDCCVEGNGSISQTALHSYVEYLKAGVASKYIGDILLECYQKSDNTFSTECLNSVKTLFDSGIPAPEIEQLLMISKNKEGIVKESFIPQLLELVKTLAEKKGIQNCLNLVKLANYNNAEYSVQMLRIINKISQTGLYNTISVARLVQNYEGKEKFLEDVAGYSINTGIPIIWFSQESFYAKQKSHLQVYSTLMERKTPFYTIKNIALELPVYANTDIPLSSFHDFIKNRPDFPPELLPKLIDFTLREYSKFPEYAAEYNYANSAYHTICEEQNISENDVKNLSALRNQVLANAELYINHEHFIEVEIPESIYKFFTNQYEALIDCINIFDKESTNNLLRHRLYKAEEYLEILHLFQPSQKALLKEMVQSYNIDGRTFTPTQKIEFIDLLYAYETSKIPVNHIKEMTREKRIDINTLEFDLFKKILSNYDITEKDLETVPKEKLQAWNLRYIHFLAQELEESNGDSLGNLIKASLFTDFEKFIHDKNNDYGTTNHKTKKMFLKQGLDYEKWINPDKSLEVQFKTIDNNAQQLELMAKQTEEDIATLLKTPALNHLFTKRFPQNMQDGYFKVLPDTYSSKTKFEDFLKNLNHQLEDVWTRAENNRDKNPKASATLTVKDHIEERLAALSKFKDNKNIKNLDWTIKLWDRVPQKDLFQGNYSTCCIGIGRSNGEFMPTYLMNTVFNMIELVDNNTGKTIGNALCYFVKNKSNKPAFVIDNIEINNSIVLSKENSIKLRESIVEYVSKLTKDISGKENIPIYLSTNYNDVNCEGLQSENIKMTLLGDTESFITYLDMFHDGDANITTKDEYTRRNTAYILKQ